MIKLRLTKFWIWIWGAPLYQKCKECGTRCLTQEMVKCQSYGMFCSKSHADEYWSKLQ